jgi:hypothetical protein
LLPDCNLKKTLSEDPNYSHLPRHPIHRILNNQLNYQAKYELSPTIELNTLPFGIHPMLSFTCLSDQHSFIEMDPNDSIANISVYFNVQINTAFAQISG